LSYFLGIATAVTLTPKIMIYAEQNRDSSASDSSAADSSAAALALLPSLAWAIKLS
jgi:hypothetical protein